MISIIRAVQLRDAGLSWEPADGDWFVIDVEGMRKERFMLSAMVVERARGRSGQPIFHFNGTTEWALDSVEQREAIWIPREDQLRERLGDSLVSLQRADEGWAVTVHVGSGTRTVDADDPADAYALALLQVLTAAEAAAS